MKFLAVVSLLLVSSPAFAGRDRDNDSGGGRLGQVTSGIDRATDKPSSSSSSSGSSSSSNDSSDSRSDDSSCCYTSSDYSGGYSSGSSSGPPWKMPPIDVDVEAFAGAQKVYESGGSLSAAFSVLFNQRFRLNARATHFFEDQMDGSRITLTLPTMTAGLRIGDLGATKLWAEGGVAHIRTVDPAGSAAITGGSFGATITHTLSPRTTFVASGAALLFDGVQAYSGRAGVRFNHVELAFSVLDFSVGPALYGPELGFGF
jgi:hypothetical protein